VLPLVLVTNDDGIASPFLPPLLRALAARARVVFAVPSGERSWIGKAMSRNKPVACTEATCADLGGWALDGTPSDCVNIALEHLLGEPPELVVSGINIGINAGLPFITGSGTVGGALEAAFHGLPAVALSQQLTTEDFERIQRGEPLTEALRGSLEESARVGAERALSHRGEAQPAAARVHNYNFPSPHPRGTPVVRTVPAPSRMGGLFRECRPGVYEFKFGFADKLPWHRTTDSDALRAGHISHTVLDFSRLGCTEGL
jgi:5'-nucleotidase